MPQRIPIKVARNVGREYGCKQVILLAWDGKLTHIVTWGETVDDCSQAADGGNRLKEKWGWPECNDQPSRVRKLLHVARAAYHALNSYQFVAREVADALEKVIAEAEGRAISQRAETPVRRETEETSHDS